MKTSLKQRSNLSIRVLAPVALIVAAFSATPQAWAAEGSTAATGKPRPVVATTTVQIQHRTVDLAIDFDTFSRNLIGLLGHYNPADPVIGGSDLKRGLERLKASQGEQGLMLFDSPLDHGVLFPLIGQPARKSFRFHIGNPLIAIQMERKNMGIALYAPLTILAYERAPGSIRVEYDMPSSSFGQFQDADINKVAAVLDTKLHLLLLKAAEVPE
ncbi:DUF302 domain-containing protein [Rhodoferax ferrireducens]|uniref:DUF302 domain-containing protein n=1 Tax=Rhodoferax ferrireducens TaxID=192843 RepID=UPI000E0DC157|nr:DUF302 domain-containing protein [Rhodoferax ferrireducens]